MSRSLLKIQNFWFDNVNVNLFIYTCSLHILSILLWYLCLFRCVQATAICLVMVVCWECVIKSCRKGRVGGWLVGGYDGDMDGGHEW